MLANWFWQSFVSLSLNQSELAATKCLFNIVSTSNLLHVHGRSTWCLGLLGICEKILYWSQHIPGLMKSCPSHISPHCQKKKVLNYILNRACNFFSSNSHYSPWLFLLNYLLFLKNTVIQLYLFVFFYLNQNK